MYATQIETPDNVVPHPRASAIYYSVADTAKLVRADLKAAFPATKFSVKSKSYSGGASITVTWFDGPTNAAVDHIVQKFSGADFDGMQDLKTYHDAMYKGRLVHFGANFIFATRKLSPSFLRAVAEHVCTKYALDVPEIITSDYDGSGRIDRSIILPAHLRSYCNDCLAELVYKYAEQAAEYVPASTLNQ